MLFTTFQTDLDRRSHLSRPRHQSHRQKAQFPHHFHREEASLVPQFAQVAVSASRGWKMWTGTLFWYRVPLNPSTKEQPQRRSQQNVMRRHDASDACYYAVVTVGQLAIGHMPCQECPSSSTRTLLPPALPAPAAPARPAGTLMSAQPLSE